jgi:UrcA family protein
MNISRTLAPALAALATLPALSPALAAELDPGTRTVAVSLAGLDLMSTEDVATAYRRLKIGAQSVCKNLHTLELGLRHTKWERCVQGALTRAIADIKAPALTAYSLSKVTKAPLVARQP